MKSEESQSTGKLKSEEDEDFLKICYPDSSKFMEVPLYEKGKILFVDVKLMEPKIIALKLIHGETARLHKPVNGIFKEPAKKWSNFKVIAVLNDSTNGSSFTTPSMNIITSTLKADSVGTKVTNVVSKPIKQEVSSASKDNEFQLSTATSRAQTRPIKQETPNSTLESHADQYRQAAIKSSGIGNVVVKQETLSIDRHNDESITYTSVQSNISVNADNRKGYENNSFDFFTSSFISKKKIKSFKCMKRNLKHGITVAKLKLPFDDSSLFAKLFFLKRNLKKKYFHNLKDIFPESGFCTSCNTTFVDVYGLVDHIFSHQHMHTGLTQEELDKLIKAVSFIHLFEKGFKFRSKPSETSTNVGGLQQSQFVDQLRLPTPSLNVAEKHFTNQFYSKLSFDKLKRIILCRIIEADLKYPFIKDRSFIEKILFLRENHHRIPKMKKTFPITNVCKNCNKHLPDHSSQLAHILSNEHIGASLTQKELNKIYKVIVAEIRYSNTGFCLKNIESQPQKRKMVPENSSGNAKRQRQG